MKLRLKTLTVPRKDTLHGIIWEQGISTLLKLKVPKGCFSWTWGEKIVPKGTSGWNNDVKMRFGCVTRGFKWIKVLFFSNRRNFVTPIFFTHIAQLPPQNIMRKSTSSCTGFLQAASRMQKWHHQELLGNEKCPLYSILRSTQGIPKEYSQGRFEEDYRN